MTTRSDFGASTNGTDVAQVFSERIKGRVVLITGVSPSSIGGTLATIIACHQPAQLILASRTLANLQSVSASITAANPTCHPSLVQLDLASQASVRLAAKSIASLTREIHVLIHTAAAVSSSRVLTVDGFESQLAITHLGPFLLTNLLTPLLLSAASTSTPGSVRVINTSSDGHRLAPFRFSDPFFTRHPVPADESPRRVLPKALQPTAAEPYKTFISYAQAKTANVLHSIALTARLADRGVRSFAVHPGAIRTPLTRSMSPADSTLVEAGVAGNWVTLDQGTATLLVAALDPGLDGLGREHGVYMTDCRMVQAAKFARDEKKAAELWALSERLTAGVEAKL